MDRVFNDKMIITWSDPNDTSCTSRMLYIKFTFSDIKERKKNILILFYYHNYGLSHVKWHAADVMPLTSEILLGLFYCNCIRRLPLINTLILITHACTGLSSTTFNLSINPNWDRNSCWLSISTNWDVTVVNYCETSVN